MLVLGIRCGTASLHYTLLRGTQGAPELVATKRVAYPAEKEGAGLLNWASREVFELCHTHKPTSVHVKRPEGGKHSPALRRIEVEAVTLEAAHRAGVADVASVRKSQLKKQLAFEGKARYVTSTGLPTILSGPATINEEARDATATALAALPR